MGGPRATEALSNFPAYRAVLLLITIIPTHAWLLIYTARSNLNGINLLPTTNAAPINTKFFTMY